METKLCSICKDKKQLKEFSKAGKGKYRPCCKICYKERYGEKEKLSAQRSYQNNKEKRDIANKKWRKDNPEQIKRINKKSYEVNKENILENQKQIRKNNPQYYTDWARNKERIDLHFKITRRLRNRIYSLIKGNKSQTTLELLGCSIEEFKSYIENKFEEWMTWENYGRYDESRQTWHIDHIKPCDLFDLTKEEDQKICFHYKNLQPLLAHINLTKGNKYESD